MLVLTAACGGASSRPPDTTIRTTAISPTVSAAVTTAPGSITYTVKSGDTLSQIADELGVSVAALRSANPNISGDDLKEGDVLVVPQPRAPSGVDSSPASSSVVASVDLLTVVDKQHSLPADYIPPDLTAIPDELLAPGSGGNELRAEAETALVNMLRSAADDGLDVSVRSSFRSYATQQTTFQFWVDNLGEEEARRVSAEPGHSEHQLGTAVDLTTADVDYDLIETFGSTPGGEWLQTNSYRFGYALSYPSGKEDVTGYAYEPWHFRYIGIDPARGWHESGLTLVEYLKSL